VGIGHLPRLLGYALPGAVVLAWAVAALLTAPFLARGRTPLHVVARVVASLVVFAFAGFVLMRPLCGLRAPLYETVKQIVRRPAPLVGRRLLVHGYVEEGSLVHEGGTARLRFNLRDASEKGPRSSRDTIEARYEGAVPDAFRDGSEVIVAASLTRAGELDVVPGGIAARCRPRPDDSSY
jgi:cytochrome c-type biogenesis protein CcmE